MITILSRSKRRVLLVLLVVSIAGWLIHSYYQHSKKPQENPIAVTVSSLKQKDVTIQGHAVGNVQPYVTVAIKPRVEGQLLAVGFKEGELVNENQIIFQIDPGPFQVALQQAQANLARDQAALQNLKKIRERYLPLVKKGFVSKQDFDQADANVKAQEAAVLSDRSSVAAAQLNVDYCTVRSPIHGKTGNLLINKGNLAKIADPNPLVVINQISPIYVAFSLPEQYVGFIQEQLKTGKVPVEIRGKQSHTVLSAELSFIDNAVDTSTGMIKLKAVFANQSEELWPGEYVDVTLPLAHVKNAAMIPTRAIQAGPEGPYVFVVNNDSHVTLKSVQTKNVIDDDTIVEGLAAGSTVVVTGQAQLADGSLISAVNTRSIA